MAHWITCVRICDGMDAELLFECSACSCRSEQNSCYCPDCGEKMENGIKLEVVK